MANKPWRAKRTNVLTVSGSVVKLPGAPVNAQVLIDPGGADNSLIWRAVKPGVDGNLYQVTYVDPGENNASLSIAIRGSIITVNLATSDVGAITTTAQQILTLANALDILDSVVRVIANGTISGVVAAVVPTPLANGAAPSGDFLTSFSHARIFGEAQACRFKADGTDPSSSEGAPLSSGGEISLIDPTVNYRHYLENLRFIRTSGSDATLQIEYIQL